MQKIIKAALIAVLLFSQIDTGFSQENKPQRIISLAPTITEEIYLLGAQDRLVADTVYCLSPPDAQKKEKIGTVVKVNLEKIVSLNPDLVLSTSLVNSKTIEKLQNLGIKVVIFPAARNFEEICRQFLELAQLLGNKKDAEQIIKQSKDRLGSVKKRVRGLREIKVFMQIGARPLFTATRDSFLNDFIEFAGGRNIVSQTQTGLYSREEVLKSNPDVIIISDMGIAGEDEMKIWQKYKNLNAARDNRIYIIDSYKLCSPTPVSFAETLDEIVEILHPKN